MCAENEMSNQKEQVVPNPKQSKAEHLEALLDEALRESFPASDSIAITIERAVLGDRDRIP
jgi:hypothetical protein